MSFTVVFPGSVAKVLSDGKTYRVVCAQCGRLPETTDRGQARAEAGIHNTPDAHRSARPVACL
jgi:hypothetical protein